MTTLSLLITLACSASVSDEPTWYKLPLREMDEVPVTSVHPSSCVELLTTNHLGLPGSNSTALLEMLADRVQRTKNGDLAVDPVGIGNKWKTLDEEKVTVLAWFQAGRTTKLQFFRRDNSWWACSAALLETTKGPPVLQLLDANADGDYLDPSDLVRFHDGVFRPIGSEASVDDGEVSWVFRLEPNRNKIRLQYAVRPDFSEKATAHQRKALQTVNRLRNEQGLSPAVYSESLSDGLMKHTQYLQHHDPNKKGTLPSYMGEDRERALYTTEGDLASNGGSVAFLTQGIDTERHVTSLMEGTHVRSNLFIAGRPQLGYGKTKAWSFLRVKASEGETGADYWVLPGAGARNQPATCSGGWPFPKSYPTLYEAPRGMPISITIPGYMQDDDSFLTTRALSLVYTETGKEIGGFFFIITDILTQAPPDTWFFVPAAPLERSTKFLAQATLERRMGTGNGPGILVAEETVQWQFTTAD